MNGTYDAAARALLLVVGARVLRTARKAGDIEQFDGASLLVPFVLFWLWVFLMALVLGDFDLGVRRRIVAALRRVGDVFSQWSESRRRRLRRVVVAVSCAVVVVQVAGLLVDRGSKLYFGTDAVVFSRHAVELVLSGENPYAESMAPAAERFPFNPAFQTARIDGTIVDSFSYPAMAIWWFVPQVAMGSDAIDLTPLLVLLVAALVMTLLSHWTLSWVPALILGLHSDLLYFTGGGVFDVLWVLPLMGSMYAWSYGRTGYAGVWLGIACAAKQTPWLVAPFLLIWALREGGPRKASALVGGSVASFAVVNLPFLLWDPVAWFYGVLTPVAGRTPLVGQGEGLILLNTIGAVDASKGIYGAVMVSVFLLSLALYTTLLPRVRWLGWVAPAVTLWFAWRSLHNYFVFWLPIAFWAVLLRERLPFANEARAWSLRGPLVAWAVVAGVLVAAVPEEHVTWEPRWVDASDPEAVGRLTEIRIELTNRGDRTLDPVFSVVHSRFQTVMHWERSPDTPLDPGQSRIYRLRAPELPLAPPDGADVHLWVRDRGASPAASLIERDVRAASPPIVNGELRFPQLTHRGVSVPWGWWLGWSPLTWPWTASLSPAATVETTAEGVHLALDDTHTLHRERRIALGQRIEPPLTHVRATWESAVGAFVELSAGGHVARFALEGDGDTELSVESVLDAQAFELYRAAPAGVLRFGIDGDSQTSLILRQLVLP
ncbi:MAG: hypothetical protein AAF654_13180 [Myxococcota bacterium]